MALSIKSRKELLALNLPKSQVVRDQLQDYMARTGLKPVDFATRINYSSPAVNNFISGRYEQISSNDAAIRKAIVDFIAAHPIAAPTALEGKLYETENVSLLRKYFNESVERSRAYYVEGDPGTQKSYVLRHLVAELNQREISKNGHGHRAFYIYCPQKVTRWNLMKAVAAACGTNGAGDASRIIRNLRFDFMKRKVTLVLDEAQHLDVDCLETVRELYDLPPHFGLLFAGSHQLERMFRTNALQLEQWNSRFHAGRRLPGITDEEAAHIIRSEIGQKVSAEAVKKLIQKSRVTVTASKGEHEYISARRLFGSVRDLKEGLEARQSRKAATA